MVASVPGLKTITGGNWMEWSALAGTTWHSLQFTAARMVLSVRCSRWVPTTEAGEPAGAIGGADASRALGLPAGTVRDGSPWQAVQLADTFATPFTWPPPATLIVPFGFTVDGWHWLQVAGVTVPVSAGWPVGGSPWQFTHWMPVSVQIGVAAAPRTPLKSNPP